MNRGKEGGEGRELHARLHSHGLLAGVEAKQPVHADQADGDTGRITRGRKCTSNNIDSGAIVPGLPDHSEELGHRGGKQDVSLLPSPQLGQQTPQPCHQVPPHRCLHIGLD